MSSVEFLWHDHECYTVKLNGKTVGTSPFLRGFEMEGQRRRQLRGFIFANNLPKEKYGFTFIVMHWHQHSCTCNRQYV